MTKMMIWISLKIIKQIKDNSSSKNEPDGAVVELETQTHLLINKWLLRAK